MKTVSEPTRSSPRRKRGGTQSLLYNSRKPEFQSRAIKAREEFDRRIVNNITDFEEYKNTLFLGMSMYLLTTYTAVVVKRTDLTVREFNVREEDRRRYYFFHTKAHADAALELYAECLRNHLF